MQPDLATLAKWCARLSALRAPPCAMAHESVVAGAGARPMRSARSPSGYARAGICPEAVRAGHLGCSHTTARHLLRDALDLLPGEKPAALHGELNELENAISLLDHRRYDAETRYAQARDADGSQDLAAARRAIDELVAEHRVYAARALVLRDAVLARLNAALARGDRVEST